MPTDEYVQKLGQFIEDARRRAADGWSVADLAAVTLDGVRFAMTMLDGLSMQGQAKKGEVLRVVDYMFDAFSDGCVPLVAKPIWWLVRPAAKALVLQIASGAVESLLPVIRGDK